MLTNAAVPFRVEKARVDEEMIRAALQSEDAHPRDIADALAESKARKVSHRNPGNLVLGCDQVLEFEGRVLAKPESLEDAREQLTAMRGKRHRLLSAAVIYEDAEPIWRHVGVVRMQLRSISDDYLEDYLARNWQSARQSVGAYKLEEEGVRLFERVEGDYFTVLGMPLLEILSFLTVRGDLKS
ncbi:septum formation protein [Salinihabitans flavidus]|uniref:Nucleoside triphosphate pyrophosphatase n=2 Tax=Salinihabitans flavidus TaxID=569882 RepID=A0A1H8LZM2_9RHOB|nr:septum formation protein [Salinihabitans flavidus]